MLSPACVMAEIAKKVADCPEAVATAAAPPSRAAMRCSKTSTVGCVGQKSYQICFALRATIGSRKRPRKKCNLHS